MPAALEEGAITIAAAKSAASAWARIVLGPALQAEMARRSSSPVVGDSME